MDSNKSGAKDTFFSRKKTINCGGKLLTIDKPLVMGILNITPDSFYDGGFYDSETVQLEQTQKMLDEGADIIDIGAVSTRPGAKEVSKEEELKKIVSVIELLLKNFPEIIISVDTYRADVAKIAIESGAKIINDISGGIFDSKMFETVADLNVPYIMMHIKGTPENMQLNPDYSDVVKEIIFFFSQQIDKLKKIGVNDVIIDPGFGFGKTLENNYELLKKLDNFKIFELPLLVGFSRKSMINKILNTKPSEALTGTTVLNTIALMNGANILRVHDVKPAVEAIKIVNKGDF